MRALPPFGPPFSPPFRPSATACGFLRLAMPARFYAPGALLASPLTARTASGMTLPRSASGGASARFCQEVCKCRRPRAARRDQNSVPAIPRSVAPTSETSRILNHQLTRNTAASGPLARACAQGVCTRDGPRGLARFTGTPGTTSRPPPRGRPGLPRRRCHTGASPPAPRASAVRTARSGAGSRPRPRSPVPPA